MFNLWRSTTFILIFFSLDIVVVILFTNIIGLIYSFWNYIREVLILWTNLLSLYQKIKDLYKSCRSCEVTQLCRWKLFHLNLFSSSKLDLKIIFAVCRYLTAECHICGTRQIVCLPCAYQKTHGKQFGTRLKFCTRQTKRHMANTRFPVVTLQYQYADHFK